MPDDDQPPPDKKIIRMQPRPKKTGFRPILVELGRILRTEPELGEGQMFRHDHFCGQTMLMMRVPRPNVPAPPGIFKPRPTDQNDIDHLCEWFEANGAKGKVAVTTVERAVRLEGYRNAFSSAREVLDRLPQWDQIPRLDTFWQAFCGAQTHEEGMSDEAVLKRADYLKYTARCFFIGLVARILEPGCKHDEAIILEGPQGSLKSTLLRAIAFDRDEWFSDSMEPDLSNRNGRAHIAGKLIIELAELVQLTRSKVESVKQFLSARDDKFRPAYGRGEIDQKRQCLFAGTTNADDYLIDPTGNRRFWPIKCGAIELEKARAAMWQLYAEALVAYRAKEPHHLPKHVEIIAAVEQRARLTDDPWEPGAKEAVRRLRREAEGKGEIVFWVTTTDVLETIKVKREDWNKAMQMRAATMLSKLGGVRGRVPYGHREFQARGYRFDRLEV